MPEIPLTKGHVAIVDDCDYSEISKHKWYFASNGYACRKKEGKIVSMHREIMRAKLGENIDHINHDKLDNRRPNLRICNQSENMANARVREDSVSMYKGVSWSKKNKKWRSRLHVKRKEIHLGLFDCPHDAARMYNFWALDIFGEFAFVNKIRDKGAVV